MKYINNLGPSQVVQPDAEADAGSVCSDKTDVVADETW